MRRAREKQLEIARAPGCGKAAQRRRTPRPCGVPAPLWFALCLFIAATFSSAAQPRIDTNSLAAAERAIGLEFTPQERTMMTRTLNGRLDAYEALRKESFPNELAPALVFNPLPTGFRVETEQRRSQWKPA